METAERTTRQLAPRFLVRLACLLALGIPCGLGCDPGVVNDPSTRDQPTGNAPTGNPQTGDSPTGNPQTGNPQTGNPQTGDLSAGGGAVGDPGVDGSIASGARPVARRSVGRRPVSKRAGKRNITFDDLEFEIERDGVFDPALLTDEIRAMEGQSLVLRGFILAASVYQQRGIRQFVLVRDNQECCFGPGAYIYHNCQVECVPGVSTSFSIRPVAVHGTLQFKPLVGPDGKCLSVYHITATRIE